MVKIRGHENIMVFRQLGGELKFSMIQKKVWKMCQLGNVHVVRCASLAICQLLDVPVGGWFSLEIYESVDVR